MIYNIIKNINIFAMGEATHGNSKIESYRNKIFKKLVIEYNYKVFILENEYTICEEINDFIQTGNGNIKGIMSAFYWPWQTEEMYKLIIWMRKYNKNKTNFNKIEFHGVDISFNGEFPVKDISTYNYFKKKVINYNKIKDNKKNFYYKNNFRDKGMYQMFNKIYNKNKKYFIWMHNGHVAKNDNDIKIKPFGYHMKKKYGQQYYVLGNTFYSGKYIGISENYWISKKIEMIIADLKDVKWINKIKIKSGIYTDKEKIKNIIIISVCSMTSSIDQSKFIHYYKCDICFDGVIVTQNEKPKKLLF